MIVCVCVPSMCAGEKIDLEREVEKGQKRMHKGNFKKKIKCEGGKGIK